MNPILTQLPKAQEMYERSMAALADVDTTPLHTFLITHLPEMADKKALCLPIGGIEAPVAEKTAIELAELGYRTTVVADQPRANPDGSLSPRCLLHINWAYCADNRRDAFTV
jgi:hypothetical protein